jgi:hypothetical protein
VDDILVMARTRETMIDTFMKPKEEAKGYGLIVNKGKTEYMKYGRRKTNESKLEMEFEKILSLKYLGSVVNRNNEIEKVKERINAGNKAFYANKMFR